MRQFLSQCGNAQLKRAQNLFCLVNDLVVTAETNDGLWMCLLQKIAYTSDMKIKEWWVAGFSD